MSNIKNIVIGIILLVILSIFVWIMGSWNRDNDLPEPIDLPDEEEIITVTPIDAFHRFENGVHELAGTIMTPTPCHELHWTVTSEGATEPVFVDFTINQTDPEQICIQVIDEKGFYLSIDADEDIEFVVTLDGQETQFNLIPVADDVDLQADFTNKG